MENPPPTFIPLPSNLAVPSMLVAGRPMALPVQIPSAYGQHADMGISSPCVPSTGVFPVVTTINPQVTEHMPTMINPSHLMGNLSHPSQQAFLTHMALSEVSESEASDEPDEDESDEDLEQGGGAFPGTVVGDMVRETNIIIWTNCPLLKGHSGVRYISRRNRCSSFRMTNFGRRRRQSLSSVLRNPR
jgi:hypothetical protein